jgi:hypothetical protein
VDRPPNVAPVANAGADQIVTDNDGNGTEVVALNGTASADSDGTIVSYVWREGASTVTIGVSPTVSLSVGTHTLTLQVTDDDGATATDSVVVTVNPYVPPPSPTVHIGDLDGSTGGNKSTWSATVTVAVHNNSNHGAVSNALVTGTWSGAASGSGSCTTNGGGTCQLSVGNLRKRDATATIALSRPYPTEHVVRRSSRFSAPHESSLRSPRLSPLPASCSAPADTFRNRVRPSQATRFKDEVEESDQPIRRITERGNLFGTPCVQRSRGFHRSATGGRIRWHSRFCVIRDPICSP